MTVAILGASINPERSSNQALHRLVEAGHRVFPVHPALEKIGEHKVFHTLAEIDVPVHTITMYVNAQLSDKLKDDILKLHPGRVIFNPGAENPALRSSLEKAGIQTLDACTLTMLALGSF